MKKWVVVIAVLFALGGAGNAGATPLYVWGGSTNTGAWNDVNKTSTSGSPDSLLCWAASASNLLAWGGWYGWDGSLVTEAADIYAIFDAGWSNTTGTPFYAYEWWMTDRTTSVLPGHEPFDSQGLGFYPTVDTNPTDDPAGGGSIINYVIGADVTWLETYINAQRGITATIDVGYLHSITIWGWDDAVGQIYLTDSDDGMTALRTYDYHLDGSNRVVIENYSNLYTDPTNVAINDLFRLNINGGELQPNHGDVSAVPEPATILLLGTGLAGLLLRKRR